MASSSPPPPLEQMPPDWSGETLGSPAEIRQSISAVLPAVDWSDTTWGILEGDDFTFEFNVGKDDPSDGFMIHVRGSGPAVTELFRLSEATGWFLLDCSLSEWLHHCPDPDEGWTGFQAYRDKIISHIQNPSKSGPSLGN